MINLVFETISPSICKNMQNFKKCTKAQFVATQLKKSFLKFERKKMYIIFLPEKRNKSSFYSLTILKCTL